MCFIIRIERWNWIHQFQAFYKFNIWYETECAAVIKFIRRINAMKNVGSLWGVEKGPIGRCEKIPTTNIHHDLVQSFYIVNIAFDCTTQRWIVIFLILFGRCEKTYNIHCIQTLSYSIDIFWKCFFTKICMFISIDINHKKKYKYHSLLFQQYVRYP